MSYSERLEDHVNEHGTSDGEEIGEEKREWKRDIILPSTYNGDIGLKMEETKVQRHKCLKK
ncbi:hypothetical protein HYC85_007951 [Camellia sinensis]|uniref:Uncharacterized protein n=1 Tax=Camellia sinensis TaxID=4442 RepID=A0A7J7HRB7_CAMSI|nr:hypothetical protein HYC85_007951 [Camellia sinensis]